MHLPPQISIKHMPPLSTYAPTETHINMHVHAYIGKGKRGVPFVRFSERYSRKERSSCRGLSTCLTLPQPFQPLSSSSSPPPLPTLFHWVSPRFSPSPGLVLLLKPLPPPPPPPPPPPCMKGRMEKGGSVQQANQAFCLCLCRGVRGLSTLALEQQQQQLVQRKKRERETETEGGGGDREEEKEMNRRV